ncbi:hypothetical protein [Streptomyces sp. NPDC059080]|uniref:hypothetical protein n=1 Tax=Streptomyces sp. NPDC059080 TaxID=3346718 RepID=UPI00367ADB6A
MKCTHIELSGATLTDCGNEDFDVSVRAMLSVDLSGEPEDHSVELDGLSREDISILCKKCGQVIEGCVEFDQALTALVLKLEKRLGATMQHSSPYGFEGGTETRPEEMTA